MSKTSCWIMVTVLLGLLVLVVLYGNLADTNDIPAQVSVNIGEPTYQSEYTSTVVHSQTGEISYQLVADHVDYFSEGQITWFIMPTVTMFNNNTIPTWTIKADQAKLNKNKMLYLYGHVQVDSMTDTSLITCIITDNAVVNLVTQDISSDDKVTLYGSGFNSNGMKMRGNLCNKTAELLEKVQTSYEIQNLQCTP